MKYVCELCGMLYDELTGDPKRNIPQGTLFKDLPVDYTCPVCGSEKEAFTQADTGTASDAGSESRYHSQR